MARQKLRVSIRHKTSVRLPFSIEEETFANDLQQKWEDGTAARAAERVQSSRRAAYQDESDTLFFEEQASEVAAGTWAAKRAEIKVRFPK